MKINLISIIIPIYNAELFLDKCIKSAINQTYKQIEIILINDGSNDNSFFICKKYEELDERIKLINKKNQGVAQARKDGIENSSGEFICFLDSDDTLNEKFCEVMISNIERQDLVMCGMNILKKETLIRTPHLKEGIIYIKKSIDMYIYASKIFASPCNKLYRRAFMKNKFVSNVSLGEDLLNNIDYIISSPNGSIKVIEECLYNVCLDNDNSLNRDFDLERLKKVLELKHMEFLKLVELYGDKDVECFYQKECLLGIHAFFRECIKRYRKQEVQKIFKNYEETIYKNNKWGNCKKLRIDYWIFYIMLKYKWNLGIYCFFRLKILLNA
ncbi:MAG: glycosyltransferase family 2 protein [Sarcina sp.]